MRVIGIDWGNKAMGISISDPLRISASQITNYFFNEEYNLKEASDVLKEIIGKFDNSVDEIIVGYPITTSGNKSSQTLSCEEFAKNLKILFPDIKINLVDERNTTKIALENMTKEQLKDPKKYKDMVASFILLQDYISR